MSSQLDYKVLFEKYVDCDSLYKDIYEAYVTGYRQALKEVGYPNIQITCEGFAKDEANHDVSTAFCAFFERKFPRNEQTES